MSFVKEEFTKRNSVLFRSVLPTSAKPCTSVELCSFFLPVGGLWAPRSVLGGRLRSLRCHDLQGCGMDVYKLLINGRAVGGVPSCVISRRTAAAHLGPLQHHCLGMETLPLIYDMNGWVNHVAAPLVDENGGAGGSVKLAVSAAAAAL